MQTVQKRYVVVDESNEWRWYGSADNADDALKRSKADPEKDGIIYVFEVTSEKVFFPEGDETVKHELYYPKEVK